jgi:DNA invertase Pin-like site-specific DNA recombinase
MEPSKPRVRRCAIYTRKSSEEGLEQAFNSLQAQREACEAFVQSQRCAVCRQNLLDKLATDLREGLAHVS